MTASIKAPASYLLFLPYLPLNRASSFGPWRITPLKSYEGPWLSPRFEELSKAFMGSFRNADGKPLSDMCLLHHRTRGVDGRLPTSPQRLAIRRSIEFAVLDRNLGPGNPNPGLGSATTDNCELFIWPIDTTRGRVTLSRGAMVRLDAGGYRIGERLTVPAPLELQMSWTPLSLDNDVLAGMYHLFTRRMSGPDDQTRRRIEVAVGWLAKAWRNSSSISWEDRIVFLKPGFEALSGESKTRECAEWLRDLYESQLAGMDDRSTGHLLWSPREKARHAHSYKKKGGVVANVKITDLQHWFHAFGAVRNTIIHEGVVPKLTYRTPGSSYNGSFVDTGERLLRESTKVSMIPLEYPDLWRDMLWRAISKKAIQMLARHNARAKRSKLR